MKINVIGDCDKRAIVYTLMKVCQTLGDVLIVTDDNRLLKLTDTGESGGHYQNVMICYTDEGIDDFFANFGYALQDFEHIIIDNLISADVDCYLYVEGLDTSERMASVLEYLENYLTISPYKKKMFDASTLYRLEQFESMRDMCPICKTIAVEVTKLISKPMGISPDFLLKMATEYKTASQQSKPQRKGRETGVQKLAGSLTGKGGN